ncbi:tRNA pseudouridine synthase A [Thalassobacillus devorans]|uniref:tRNA pseudouridine synthase A n=1 Tax=Thalassobacillus devorans TaxID=279813 RepID=A0ABQ1PTU4_9BACI|nr:tRNA pseudouridine(38-40) synthase TruA [Thalassobacillus devorans]NIK30765.1 tRNA pseudouridine38-40 synthase [Thalassobacillus devorans]GGD03206.1 tRNA pseudouridine synthase A [Thalassobacillus devorans]
MQKLKGIIQYDGTAFAGYQVQPNGRTIQAEIETALQKMHKGQTVKVTASGRTDAGVHAVGQMIHFTSDLDIPPEGWERALNAMLPDDIRIDDIQYADAGFHARYDTKGKEYRYKILNQKDPDLFRRYYSYHVPQKLDIAAIKEACRYLEGEHDFTSFCSARSTVKGDKVRTITKADIQPEGNELVFIFRGTGFLYNMVRILVGTLLEVGKGERKPEEVIAMIEAKDRSAAGKTAPPHGLFLWEVFY